MSACTPICSSHSSGGLQASCGTASLGMQRLASLGTAHLGHVGQTVRQMEGSWHHTQCPPPMEGDIMIMMKRCSREASVAKTILRILCTKKDTYHFNILL